MSERGELFLAKHSCKIRIGNPKNTLILGRKLYSKNKFVSKIARFHIQFEGFSNFFNFCNKNF